MRERVHCSQKILQGFIYPNKLKDTTDVCSESQANTFEETLTLEYSRISASQFIEPIYNSVILWLVDNSTFTTLTFIIYYSIPL